MNITIIEHWRTKGHYKVLEFNAQLKFNGKWQPCIIYQDYKKPNELGEYVLADTNRVIKTVNTYSNKI